MNPGDRATFSQLKGTLNRFLVECKASPPVDRKCDVQQQARGACQYTYQFTQCIRPCFLYCIVGTIYSSLVSVQQAKLLPEKAPQSDVIFAQNCISQIYLRPPPMVPMVVQSPYCV